MENMEAIALERKLRKKNARCNLMDEYEYKAEYVFTPCTLFIVCGFEAIPKKTGINKTNTLKMQAF